MEITYSPVFISERRITLEAFSAAIERKENVEYETILGYTIQVYRSKFYNSINVVLLNSLGGHIHTKQCDTAEQAYKMRTAAIELFS